jgi:hypothetical protein
MSEFRPFTPEVAYFSLQEITSFDVLTHLVLLHLADRDNPQSLQVALGGPDATCSQ